MELAESTVDEILRSEDIESLFQHGAPEDEYSGETRKIFSAVASLGQNELTEERLTEIVRDVWRRSFGPFEDEEIEMRMPAFRQVAHRIFTQESY